MITASQDKLVILFMFDNHCHITGYYALPDMCDDLRLGTPLALQMSVGNEDHLL